MKARHVIIGVAAGLVLLLVVGLLAGASAAQLDSRTDYHHGPGMMWGNGLYGGMHGFGGAAAMILFWILLLAAIVGGAALLIGGLARPVRGEVGLQEAPLEILKRGYARGEIDRDEFEQRREALT